MTDMTPEQALARMFERLDAIDGNFEWTQERDIIRNALSRPTDTEASRTLDALIALAAGDDGLPDDMRAGVERLRARLSRPLGGYAGVTVWIGDKQVTRIVDRVVLESSRADALLYEFKSARNMLAAAPESVTVRYDLSPAQTESSIRDALIRMGWTPPESASGKPSWNEAPEWAQWLAQDGNGNWHWFAECPRRDVSAPWGAYAPVLGRYARAATVKDLSPDWRETLESRPPSAEGGSE